MGKKIKTVIKVIFGAFFAFELIVDLFFRLIRNICCCAYCCCSFTFIGLLLASFVLYSVTAAHQDYFDGLSQGASMFNTNLITLASNIDTCTPFIDKFVKLWNLTLKIIYSFLAKIADALGITYQGKPIFSWAKQQYLAGVKDRQYRAEKVYNDHIENTLNTYGYQSLDQLSPGHQTRIILGATAASSAVMFQGLSFADISSACGILQSLISFAIQILKLFNVFFINIFGSIVAALIKFISNPSNGFPNLLKIILDFFKDLLINEIPFGHCLVNPMALARCMCTPKNAAQITIIDVYLVGCMFQTCDASVYPSGFIAFQYCIGLRAALDQIGLIGTAISGLLDLLGKLDKDLGGLDGSLNTLTNLVNTLLDAVGVSRLEQPHGKLQKIPRPDLSRDHHLFNQYMNTAQTALQNMHINRGPQQFDIPSLKGNDSSSVVPFNDTKATVNTTWFDGWVSDRLKDDPENPIYLEMQNVGKLMETHSDVAPDLLSVGIFGIQVVTSIHAIYNNPTDMSLDEMGLIWDKINFSSIFYSWDRLKNHTDKLEMNCTTLLFENATDAQKSLCTSSTSYIDYLTQLQIQANEIQGILEPTKPITREGKSPLELQREYEKHFEEMQFKDKRYQELKKLNKFHANNVNINFVMTGASSLLVLAGVVAALTCNTFCGGCCNNSLGICNAFGSCCPMIIAILAIFIGNMVLNFSTGTYQYDDLVGSFFQGIGNQILNQNHQQYSPEEIIQQFATISNLLEKAINNILIKIIQWGTKITAFGISIIHLPTAQDGQTVIDWLMSLIFYPYFTACGVSEDDCINGGLCIRLINPYDTSDSNYCTRECTRDNPCYDINGQCFMAPFIVPGKCASQIIPTINVVVQPQCYNKSIIDFPTEEINYTNGTEFKVCGGWSWCYISTSEFRWLLYNLGVLGFKWTLFPFRMINVGFNLMPQGIFASTLSRLPISIPGLDLLTPLTVLNYYVLPTVQSVSHSIYDVVNTPSFWPFPTIAGWWRFPNSDEYPPFGKAIASMYTCQVIYTPQAVIGLTIDGIAIIILFTLIFSPIAFILYELLFYGVFYILYGIYWLFKKIVKRVFNK